ncbi:ABC transporter ATP-binding protein [Pediococcus acidilactici]|uniref:ABC transporter ATP-binding protein n=1 Tax=Pediococcus acidilactici TaxID=1254 RepID=UPI00186A6D39|nr:ABC transporter ATP-binding protein [Pediococcus acidilactici]MDV2602656.1 ABC transporter ATP-binding protein [Pediococcus acidilactici]MDV2844080.1 ABC transporter ATP-binding protein [Pediococcus acidilactici]QOP72848.1 ABC transporter ATP-binding protein [Pediococcus acidilactici]WQS23255.1 ABC transporter ATP-binding protein [Pediococcus acidilactici]WQS26777.1 ABC transporter ATP-binding protein [Pediococcus acidilactici]
MEIERHRILKFLATVMTALSSIMVVLVAFLMKMILDCAMNKDFGALKRSIGISILYIATYFLINYLKEVLVARYIKNEMEDLRRSVYRTIMERDYQSYFSKSNGEYISALTNDMTTIEDNYYKAYFLIVQAVVTFVIAILSLVVINWQFSIGVLAIAGFFLATASFTGMGLNDLRTSIQKDMVKFTSKTKDLIAGYEVVRSFNAQDKMQEQFDRYNHNLEEMKLKFSVRQGITKVINENLVLLIIFSIMILGGWFVITGALVMGSLIAIVQLLNSVMNPINMMLVAVNNSNSTKTMRNQITEMLQNTTIKNDANQATHGTFNQEISLAKLNFSYDGAKPVIQNFSFAFQKGKKYAIIGKSGCGKSTLLRLIQNCYPNYDGEMWVDDHNYREMSDASFLNLFSMIHQNVFIFSGTIRENITLFKDFPEQEIVAAAKSAGLQFLLEKLPQGLDTPIKEAGNSLSGGERQRISIARVLIRQAPVLLLDEFTSALDQFTAQTIEKEIMTLKEQTCIHVTHKLSEADAHLYDAILEIDAGQLVKVTQPNV